MLRETPATRGLPITPSAVPSVRVPTRSARSNAGGGDPPSRSSPTSYRLVRAAGRSPGTLRERPPSRPTSRLESAARRSPPASRSARTSARVWPDPNEMPPNGPSPNANTYANGWGHRRTSADKDLGICPDSGTRRTTEDGGEHRLQRLLISGMRVRVRHGSRRSNPQPCGRCERVGRFARPSPCPLPQRWPPNSEPDIPIPLVRSVEDPVHHVTRGAMPQRRTGLVRSPRTVPPVRGRGTRVDRRVTMRVGPEHRLGSRRPPRQPRPQWGAKTRRRRCSRSERTR